MRDNIISPGGDKNAKYVLWLSLIFPFLGFIYSMVRLDRRSYHKVILFFAFWFGYTVFLYSGDVVSYYDDFEKVVAYSWSDYWYLLQHLFDEYKGIQLDVIVYNSKPDVYALTLSFLVSRFTENPRWFFALVSVVYTGLFLLFIGEVLKLVKIKRSIEWKILFAFLLLIVPFYVGVTGVRFWTALFFFLYFLLRFLNTRKQVNLFYILGAVLIHYTFVVPVLILYLYRVLGVNRAMAHVFVFASLVFFGLSSATSTLDFLNETISVLDDSRVKTSAASYTNVEVLEGRKTVMAEANWYVRWKELAVTYSMLILFLLEYFSILKIRTDNFLRSWYFLYVLFFCVTLLSFKLGSLGRFSYIFYILTIFRLLYSCSISDITPKLKLISFLLLPTLILHVLVTFRAGFYFVDPLLLVGNPAVFLMESSDISLSQLLIGH